MQARMTVQSIRREPRSLETLPGLERFASASSSSERKKTPPRMAAAGDLIGVSVARDRFPATNQMPPAWIRNLGRYDPARPSAAASSSSVRTRCDARTFPVALEPERAPGPGAKKVPAVGACRVSLALKAVGRL